MEGHNNNNLLLVKLHKLKVYLEDNKHNNLMRLVNKSLLEGDSLEERLLNPQQVDFLVELLNLLHLLLEEEDYLEELLQHNQLQVDFSGEELLHNPLLLQVVFLEEVLHKLLHLSVGQEEVDFLGTQLLNNPQQVK